MLMPARRLFPAASLFLLCALAACGGASSTAGDRVMGARGSVVDSVRGGPADSETLRPEPGNIWSEGLDQSRAPARR